MTIFEMSGLCSGDFVYEVKEDYHKDIDPWDINLVMVIADDDIETKGNVVRISTVKRAKHFYFYNSEEAKIAQDGWNRFSNFTYHPELYSYEYFLTGKEL